ncbi:hypothetical protein MX850_02415 [Erysipelothrix sp. Poltava]|nr:hypothetical protein MX850_02415 [Erysipelothrix sp. Poltava]
MRNKGTITGLFSGLFWGLDTVMIGVVLASTMFLDFWIQCTTNLNIYP